MHSHTCYCGKEFDCPGEYSTTGDLRLLAECRRNECLECNLRAAQSWIDTLSNNPPELGGYAEMRLKR